MGLWVGKSFERSLPAEKPRIVKVNQQGACIALDVVKRWKKLYCIRLSRRGRKAVVSKIIEEKMDMIDSSVLGDLLEDTVMLACEEGHVESAASFCAYITDCIPPSLLNALAELTGGEEDGEQSGDAVIGYLTSLWEERYAPPTEEKEERSWGAPKECEVCERAVSLTRHHLFPRAVHKFCLKQNLASPEELTHRLLYVCRLCHSTIHKFFSHEQLALQYNTLDLLLANEKFNRFAKWNAGRP